MLVPWRVLSCHISFIMRKLWFIIDKYRSDIMFVYGIRICIGFTPHQLIVIVTFLVSNPYKPSFAPVTGWGVDPIYACISTYIGFSTSYEGLLEFSGASSGCPNSHDMLAILALAGPDHSFWRSNGRLAQILPWNIMKWLFFAVFFDLGFGLNRLQTNWDESFE